MIWLPGCARAPSPNHSTRFGHKPACIVIHYDGGANDDGSVTWMRNPKSRVSSHFHVGRDGRVKQLVPLHRAAWHAGKSSAPLGDQMANSVNLWSIGIELGNLGKVIHRAEGDFRGEWCYEILGGQFDYPVTSHPPERAALRFDDGRLIVGWWEPYTGPQIYALARLIGDLRDELGPLPLFGHEDVAVPPGRKIDPGPLFPWGAFDRKTDFHRTTAERRS